MTPMRWLAGAAVGFVVVAAAWAGVQFAAPGSLPAWVPRLPGRAAPEPPSVQIAVPQAQSAGAPTGGSTVAQQAGGGTPMAERVAVIGFLNKRNGEARDIVMKPGQAFRLGDAIVRLRACERTAPWEEDQLTGAFLQLDVRGYDARWRRHFSGWVFKERPALNVVQNALYDVWPKSCTMSFPETGSETLAPSAPAPRRRSSADQSPPAAPEPDATPVTPTPSASPSTTE